MNTLYLAVTLTLLAFTPVVGAVAAYLQASRNVFRDAFHPVWSVRVAVGYSMVVSVCWVCWALLWPLTGPLLVLFGLYWFVAKAGAR